MNSETYKIALLSKKQNEYISLTDIARYKDLENPTQVISLWMRTYNTIAFIGLWEQINNPNFKPHIYEGFKAESAKPTFSITLNLETGNSVTSCNLDYRILSERTFTFVISYSII